MVFHILERARVELFDLIFMRLKNSQNNHLLLLKGLQNLFKVARLKLSCQQMGSLGSRTYIQP